MISARRNLMAPDASDNTKERQYLPSMHNVLPHSILTCTFFTKVTTCCLEYLPRNLMVLQIGPQVKLMLPLVHRYAVGHETQYALLDA